MSLAHVGKVKRIRSPSSNDTLQALNLIVTNNASINTINTSAIAAAGVVLNGTPLSTTLNASDAAVNNVNNALSLHVGTTAANFTLDRDRLTTLETNFAAVGTMREFVSNAEIPMSPSNNWQEIGSITIEPGFWLIHVDATVSSYVNPWNTTGDIICKFGVSDQQYINMLAGDTPGLISMRHLVNLNTNRFKSETTSFTYYYNNNTTENKVLYLNVETNEYSQLFRFGAASNSIGQLNGQDQFGRFYAIKLR
tara:strand:- start:1863 stop:2618 length:756 start_codon:yes stop_codon:yes gene_type:complete